jgi:pilus assembly protein CpaC
MKKFALFLLIVLPLIMAAAPGMENASTVVIYTGEMKSVQTSTPTRVMIGNPAIADIISVSAKEIVLAGKGPGSTNLLWWDDNGERSARITVLTEEMSYVKSRVDDMLKQMGYTTVITQTADAEGKVLLLGSVKSVGDMNRIMSSLGENGRKVVNLMAVAEEEATIELDVEVLEVDQGGRKELGIQWPSGVTGTEPSSLDKSLKKTPDALFHVGDWARDALTAKIDFLVEEGRARVLSRPKLACQSGKEAELLVGGETPVLTTQISGTGASGTTVDYKEYGIKLKMSPVVLTDSKIKLTMAVEVSDIAETALTLGAANSPTALAYPLTKRNTNTQLVLNDSQTLAISGLIRKQLDENIQKVPFFGDLPVIGMFFRHRDIKTGKNAGGDSELVVMVTPKIIKNSAGKAQSAVEEKQPAGKQAGSFTPVASKAGSVLKPEPSAVKTEPAIVKKEAPVVQNTGAAAVVKKPETPLPAKPAQTVKQLSPLDEYALKVTEYISRQLVYPQLARRSKIEGTVKLALHVSNTGELMEINVIQSSGYPVLDADALTMSKEISPYPGFPAALSGKDIWIQVPISYRLNDKS